MPKNTAAVLRVRAVVPSSHSSQYHNPSYRSYLLEDSPRHHLLHTVYGEFFVPFPWTYYFIQRNILMGLYWSPTRIKTSKSELYQAVIPNLSGGEGPCYRQPLCPNQDQFSKVSHALLTWWDSYYNSDYFYTTLFAHRLCQSYKGVSIVNLFSAMQQLSVEDMLDPGLPWRKIRTVKRLCQLHHATVPTKLVDRRFINEKSLALPKEYLEKEPVRNFDDIPVQTLTVVG